MNNSMKFCSIAAKNMMRMINCKDILKKYETFVLENETNISTIENTLRTLVYLMPKRFNESEAGAEALHVLLSVVGLYNSKITMKNLKSKHIGLFNKYVLNNLKKSSLLSRLCYWLRFIQSFQLLIEIICYKKFKKHRSFVVLMMETIKTIIKLFIFRLNGKRMLLNSNIPKRETFKPTTVATDNINQLWTGKRTSKQYTRLDSIYPNDPLASFETNRFLSKQTSNPELLKIPSLLVKPLNGNGKIAEYLHIVNPLVFAYFSHKKEDSWIPLLLRTIVDAAWLNMLINYSKNNRKLTKLENEELKKRKLKIVYYCLLSNPMFRTVTKPSVERICSSFENTFLLNRIANIVKDHLPFYEKYHYSHNQ